MDSTELIRTVNKLRLLLFLKQRMADRGMSMQLEYTRGFDVIDTNFESKKI